MTQPTPLSSCCKAPVRLFPGPASTNDCRCSACGNPCYTRNEHLDEIQEDSTSMEEKLEALDFLPEAVKSGKPCSIKEGKVEVSNTLEIERLKTVKETLAHALYLVAEHDPQTGYESNPKYWGKTLRKALIEEEVKATKALKDLISQS